jgi:phosphohistidine phosphatase SixA
MGGFLPFRTHVPQGKQAHAQKDQAGASDKPLHLIRWSIQEVRRVACRLARRRIEPAYIIAWSLWRRAHQAAAQTAHLKQESQL